jgi:hypothetical protein
MISSSERNQMAALYLAEAQGVSLAIRKDSPRLIRLAERVMSNSQAAQEFYKKEIFKERLDRSSLLLIKRKIHEFNRITSIEKATEKYIPTLILAILTDALDSIEAKKYKADLDMKRILHLSNVLNDIWSIVKYYDKELRSPQLEKQISQHMKQWNLL